jgi:hypothetical protein
MVATMEATRHTGDMHIARRAARQTLEVAAAFWLGQRCLLTAYAANEGANASGEALLGYTDFSRPTTAAWQFAGRDT